VLVLDVIVSPFAVHSSPCTTCSSSSLRVPPRPLREPTAFTRFGVRSSGFGVRG
jgi:hypothetical protein